MSIRKIYKGNNQLYINYDDVRDTIKKLMEEYTITDEDKKDHDKVIVKCDKLSAIWEVEHEILKNTFNLDN